MATNTLGYKVLSQQMIERVMGKEAADHPPILEGLEKILLEENLRQFQIPELRSTGNEFEQDFWMPELLGDNSFDHFEGMARKFLKKFKLIKKAKWLMNSPPHPTPPSQLLYRAQPGWNRYELVDGKEWKHTAVEEIVESAAALDWETFVQGLTANSPIIGTAVNPDAAYVWISPFLRLNGFDYMAVLIGLQRGYTDPVLQFKSLLNDVHPEYHQANFVKNAKAANRTYPSVGRNKLIVNHNSAFDAVRVQERYEYFNESGTFFFDTMSAHNITHGFNSNTAWLAKVKDGFKYPAWHHGSSASLKNCWEFYCGSRTGETNRWPEVGDKKLRNIFVDAPNLKTIRESWEPLMDYSMNDPVKTHELFRVLYEIFRKHCPSLVSLASHYLVSTTVLPVDSDWYNWMVHCEKTFQKTINEINQIFEQIADGYHTDWQEGDLDPTLDPWLKHLNWKPIGKDNEGNLVATWYHKLKKTGISTKSVDSHYIMKLSWTPSEDIGPQTLAKAKEQVMDKKKGKKVWKSAGWCYTTPDHLECDFKDEEGIGWTRVPHADGSDSNVGGVLSQDYIQHFEEGTLKAEAGELATKVAELTQLSSYWLSNRQRVFDNHTGYAMNPFSGHAELVIAPHVVPNNTVTYRTGENLWLTLAAHLKVPKIGSELKAKVRPPLGCHIVNFDYDSQELGLLDIIGTQYSGISGGTPLAYGVLVGDKANGTDMHSTIAKKVSEMVKVLVKRSAAKQAVYAIMYGVGKNKLSRTVRITDISLGKKLCDTIAVNLIGEFKGKKGRGEKYYQGGLASLSFNGMTDCLSQEIPQTCILGNQMSHPIRPEHHRGNVSNPALLNWTIQSAGASMLQCTVVGMWYMSDLLKIPASFALSMHDEFVTYCHKNYSKMWAMCLQMVHLWVWGLVHYQHKLYDLPCVRAYASGISIDKLWRKEPDAKVNTPTFTRYHSKGKSCTIEELVSEVTNIKQRYEYFSNI